MDARELLKKLRHIEIHTGKLASEQLAGGYHSVFKGRGMTFSEVRQYQHGDDIRFIDWNVSARMNDTYVKVFTEEREMTVMLLVDMSGSTLFGSQSRTKRSSLVEAAALIAFSALKNNDRVGLLLFHETVERVIPPRRGKPHVMRILGELLRAEAPQRGTNLSLALDHLGQMNKRRAVVFVLSDFLEDSGVHAAGEGRAIWSRSVTVGGMAGEMDGARSMERAGPAAGTGMKASMRSAGAFSYERSLRVAAARHDVIPVVVEDPRETELPDVGLVCMSGLEGEGRVWVDTGSKRLRARFREEALRARSMRQQLFRRLRLDMVHLEPAHDPIAPLMDLFRRRARRLSGFR